MGRGRLGVPHLSEHIGLGFALAEGISSSTFIKELA